MDAPRYRIGNDLSVFWAIHNRDNSPFDMEGMDVRLFVTNERGRKEVDVVLATLPDGTINNVIRWDFKGEDQRVLGLHTLTVEISESATHREIIRDYCQAFELVGRSESETEEGDANISIGGDLILSSKLDIYRFEATNVDLSGIKESIRDISESIKDINEESVEIKVAINGIQTRVNDIGTELTTKASVETVVEIGEQITEVQTNVAEQTIRVNSLEAEIETKASAESVTNIADELKITNETLAQQVVKVTDLTAEVATKASSEMVTEIAYDLKITSNTLAEQALKVDALSAEVSTKASAESVADITEDLQLVEKSVAEQTLRVDAMSAEIATKASSERVLALEGDVAVVEKAVAEQTVKVEGLEASIENKVSREEFNEKTGELDQSYTSLKQTADSLTLEVGEQGEALTKVEADVNGLSVRVDDIGDAQANYDETLSELTEILTPEQMSTQIGKGVVLSTVIATRDEDGDITAGMNASSVHSDPVHGRVVIAGGVKNKSDWTKATGILYEDGHMVVNSGEFGENVKIGNAMFRAVLEGDFDVFSYPENGALVPLFQVNKDSDGKIVSVSTPYDFIANKNLIVHGDTSSGGEGSGEVVIGTTSIVVDGVSYPSKDGVIDLSKAFEGLQVEIDLSDYATKDELLVVNNRLVSLESYFSTSEDADTQINKWNEIVAFLNATEGTTLAGILAAYYTKAEVDNKVTTINNSITALDDKYAPVKTWYDALASLIVKDGNNVRIKTNLIVEGDTASGGTGGGAAIGVTGILVDGKPYTDNDSDGYIDLSEAFAGLSPTITSTMITEALGYTPADSASLGSLAYKNGLTASDVGALSTSGGTIGVISDEGISINRTNGTRAVLSFKVDGGYKGGLGIDTDGVPFYRAYIGGIHTLLHSGNVGDYALKTYGTDMPSNIVNYVGFGKTAHSWKTTGAALSFGIDSYYAQIQVDYESGDIFTRNYNAGTFGSWKTIAFTDSNVASATKLATARTIWGQSFDGTGDITGTLYNVKSILFESDSTYDVGTNTKSARYIYTTWIGAKIGQSFRLGANDGTHMTINSSGNVLIGTTTDAGYKLYVDGTARISDAVRFAHTLNVEGAVTMESTLDVTSDVTTNTRFYAPYIFLGKNSEGIYASTNRISWHDTSNSYKTELIVFDANEISLKKPVAMSSTLSVGSYMTFNNGDIMYARDEGGTLRYIMGLTSVLSFGYESASAGIDTHIYGNSIHLHHGTSRGTGLSLYSDGSSQLHGNTTINGNLVVTGDISA